MPSIAETMKFLTALLAAILAGSAVEAEKCACANTNVHIRSGPGTSFSIMDTLQSGRCLPHDGQSQVGGAYTWLHLDYNGQSTWAASDYFTVRDCHSSSNSTGSSTSSQVQLPGCPRIVTRAEWGARAPKVPHHDMPDLPVYVFLHHGASSECFDKETCIRKVQGYQNWHMDGHGWNDIGYNFVVGEDGNAYEARGWTSVGAHTKGYNTVGIAICVIGDFTSHVPNSAALNTVRQLIQCGLDNGKISPSYTLKGHRDVGTTACPGDSYYALIQSWPHYVAAGGLWSASN